MRRITSRFLIIIGIIILLLIIIILLYKRSRFSTRNIHKYIDPHTGRILYSKFKSFNDFCKFRALNPIKGSQHLVDKIQVKDIIKNLNIPNLNVTKIYYIIDNPQKIDNLVLSKDFAMKLNNGSSMNIIVKNNIIRNGEHKGQKVTKKILKDAAKIWLKSHFGNRPFRQIQKQYSLVDNKVFFEELLPISSSKEPIEFDYRVFNGVPKNIAVDVDIGSKSLRRNIYDLNWNLLPMTINLKNTDYRIPKPKNLNIMTDIIEQLGKTFNFDFVRIDLYNINGKIYFGEFTFTPGACETVIKPKEYDQLFLDYLKK